MAPRMCVILGTRPEIIKMSPKIITTFRQELKSMRVANMDMIVAMNLAFCIVIVGLGYWGYRLSRKISKVLYLLPAFVGVGFGLFGVSHFVTLIGMAGAFAQALIVVRALGYITVIVSMIWVINSSIRLHREHAEARPKDGHSQA